jgi:hypothetical protein
MAVGDTQTITPLTMIPAFLRLNILLIRIMLPFPNTLIYKHKNRLQYYHRTSYKESNENWFASH